MNIVLLLGLLTRQRKGPANISIESVLILALYFLGSGLCDVVWLGSTAGGEQGNTMTNA